MTDFRHQFWLNTLRQLEWVLLASENSWKHTKTSQNWVIYRNYMNVNCVNISLFFKNTPPENRQKPQRTKCIYQNYMNVNCVTMSILFTDTPPLPHFHLPRSQWLRHGWLCVCVCVCVCVCACACECNPTTTPSTKTQHRNKGQMNNCTVQSGYKAPKLQHRHHLMHNTFIHRINTE